MRGGERHQPRGTSPRKKGAGQAGDSCRGQAGNDHGDGAGSEPSSGHSLLPFCLATGRPRRPGPRDSHQRSARAG